MGTVYNFDSWDSRSFLKIDKSAWCKVEEMVKKLDYSMAVVFERGYVVLKCGSKMWCGYADFLEFLESLEPYVVETNWITITNDCDNKKDEFHFIVRDGKCRLVRETEYD